MSTIAPPAFDLTGKVALITGASSGLGAHFARTLSAAGAELILVARNAVKLEQFAKSLGGTCSCTVAGADVSDPAQMDQLAAQFENIDILINNAGIVRSAPALDVTDNDWADVVGTNLGGMFYAARAVARSMKTRGGTIVNIASILGLRQAGGVLPYAVAKAGVIQMTKVLALELARFGIRVNALAPGYIDTDLNRSFWETDPGRAMIARIPQRRLGRPEDLDGPLLLLASNASAYMTGSVLAVDGGHLVSGL